MLTRAQRWLIVGGLLVVGLGSVYGLVYNLWVNHQTLPRLREPYRQTFEAAARGQAQEAQAALERAKTQNYQFVRAIDVHTHWIKMGSLAILLGLILHLVEWKEKMRAALALFFIGSAVLFPLGVFLEIFSPSLLAPTLAAAGAVLAIGSFTLLLIGIFKGMKSLSPPRESSP